MNKKALYSLTHGMYVLCTNGAACFVDAVCQISGGDHPLISVAVMKKNYTNEVLHEESTFSISVFGMEDDPKIIENFGFHSQRDFEKFEYGEWGYIHNTPVFKGTISYLVCDIVDRIENDTHTVFIGRVVEAEVEKPGDPMSYGYYQKNKNDIMHKEEAKKVTLATGETAWVCTVCGYVYVGEELPEDFKCPLCGVGKELFEKKE